MPPTWEQVDAEVLKLEKIEQVVVSRPGVNFYLAADYFGPIKIFELHV